MNLNNMAINMMMGQLKNNNPNAYNELQGYINSGKSPEVVLNELLSSGRFTSQQVEQAKNMMNQQQNQYNGPRF